jgi:hypothetical protein
MTRRYFTAAALSDHGRQDLHLERVMQTSGTFPALTKGGKKKGGKRGC